MRLKFTGRMKIEKQHALIEIPDDPPGSGRGYYFYLRLDLTSYKLPPEALIFVEATRKNQLMRFEYGTVTAPAELSPLERRLTDFGESIDGLKFRIKVVQPNGPEAGKLLAEADGITAGEVNHALPLIRVVGDSDMGETPWRLELVPTDADLPTLHLNSKIGGKVLAEDDIAEPLLMTAAVREVFTRLVRDADTEDEDDNHWASLWSRFAQYTLNMPNPDDVDTNDDDSVRDWVEEATHKFADLRKLAGGLADFFANRELQDLEEIN